MRGFRVRNLLLAGLGAGLLWCAVSAFSATASASASDEPGTGGLGLLGAVSQTVSTVSSTVDTLTDTVDDTVGRVQDVLAPAPIAPPSAPAPGPAVVPSVGDAVDVATDAVAQVVGTVTKPAAAIVGAAPVSQITAPVAAALPSIPVVGPLLASTPIPPLLTHVAGGVDQGLTTIVGAPGAGTPPWPPAPPTGPPTGSAGDADGGVRTGGILLLAAAPGDPAQSRPSAGATSVTSGGHVRLGSASAVLSPPPGSGAPGDPPAQGDPVPPPPAPAGPTPSSGGSGASGAGASAPPVALPGDRWLDPGADLIRPDRHDDELPGSPVFPTDVSPD